MDVVVAVLILGGLVAAVVIDGSARQRGPTDPRWRRVGKVLHAALTVGVFGLFGLIALLLFVLFVFRPIGGP